MVGGSKGSRMIQVGLGDGKGFPGDSDSKESARIVGDLSSIPGAGRAPGEGNGNPLQYSCLENPMDGGASRATVHGGPKESDTTERLHFHFQGMCGHPRWCLCSPPGMCPCWA